MPERNAALPSSHARVCLLDMSWLLRARHFIFGLFRIVMQRPHSVADKVSRHRVRMRGSRIATGQFGAFE